MITGFGGNDLGRSKIAAGPGFELMPALSEARISRCRPRFGMMIERRTRRLCIRKNSFRFGLEANGGSLVGCRAGRNCRIMWLGKLARFFGC